MFKKEYLSTENLSYLEELNISSLKFNKLNKDVMEAYNNCNIFKKILLKRRIHLLKRDDKYVGFIWVTNDINKNGKIEAMYVEKEFSDSGYKELTSHIKENFIYESVETSYNSEILKSIGFNKQEGVIIMQLILDDYLSMSEVNKDLEFVKFTRLKDEYMRCRLQNEIFDNESRIPLSTEDIFFDENQDYYIEDSSIFLVYQGEYIGYGQIILENDKLFIVNFGIIDKYRRLNFGKALLNHLITIGKGKRYDKIFLKVNIENIPALRLYKSLGFEEYEKYYIYEFKR